MSRFAPRGGGLSGLSPRFADNIIIYNRVPREVMKKTLHATTTAPEERERESCCCSLRVFDATLDAVFGECGKNRLKRFYIISVIILFLLSCRCLLLFVGSASLVFCATVYGPAAGRDNRLTDST